MEGIILEAESGDYLGNHRGFWFYTIGQRQGLRLAGGPWYVQPFNACSISICFHIISLSGNYLSSKSYCSALFSCSMAKLSMIMLNVHALVHPEAL